MDPQQNNSSDDDIESPDIDAPLQGLLAHILDEMDGEESNLRDMIASLGRRSFGPVMALSGFFICIPFIGGIPGVPPAFALINIAFAIQILARRHHPWIPSILSRVKVPYERVEKAERVTRPWLKRIDNFIRPRLGWATQGPMLVIAALVAILLSLTMFPLGLIPFAVAPSAFILGLLGLAITARDGVLMMIALFLFSILPAWIVWAVSTLAQ